MTALRGWGLSDQHLALDALVAFVDGELSPCAYDRAAAHIARCAACAAEAAVQRNARTAVRSAGTPSVPPQLLNALRSIPSSAELPAQPDELALTEDGQLVTVNRGKSSFGTGAVLGSSTPLGGGQPLGGAALDDPALDDAEHPRPDRHVRRTKQGAGVVFSGLVLGALALINLPGDEVFPQDPGARAPQPGGTYTNGTVPVSGETTTAVESPAVPRPQVAAHTSPVPSESAAVTGPMR